MSIRGHLADLPADLADALVDTYRAAIDHFLKDEPDDAQVDSGRFCEAALRYLEYKMDGSYTVIDGKSAPNRKRVVQRAREDGSLAPTLRSQIPQAVELVMDFRNNRNSAHLGDLDANNMDSACVVQNVSWLMAEIARLESNASPDEVQRLVDELARRHVPLIHMIGDTPVLLVPNMTASAKVLVLLYDHGQPVDIATLRGWAEYGHATRFRDLVIKRLANQRKVYLDASNLVHLLPPGEKEAQAILLKAGSSVVTDERPPWS